MSAASLSRVVKSLSYSGKPRRISTLLLSKKGVTDACVTELTVLLFVGNKAFLELKRGVGVNPKCSDREEQTTGSSGEGAADG